MRHYPAYCSDCRHVWLVSTDANPSASPLCPVCDEHGRLIPGAYYSDSVRPLFEELERALRRSGMREHELAQLADELELALPAAGDEAIQAAFLKVAARLRLGPELQAINGKRVALRMLVTLANTLSQVTSPDSGYRKLPPPIAGLFDPVPKPRAAPKAVPEPSASSPADDDATGDAV